MENGEPLARCSQWRMKNLGDSRSHKHQQVMENGKWKT
jgi:hypothetical protein